MGFRNRILWDWDELCWDQDGLLMNGDGLLRPRMEMYSVSIETYHFQLNNKCDQCKSLNLINFKGSIVSSM